MFRFAGQFLAIVAVMASAINAQCVLACSLQGVTGNVPHEAHRVHSPRGAHACCPQQNAPTRHGKERPQQPQPCPVPLVITSDLAVASLTQYSGLPQLFAGPAPLFPYGDLPIRHYAPPVFVDSSGNPDIPAFAILRI